MLKLNPIAIGLNLIIVLSGCAGMTKAQIEKPQVSRVQKVAIVGFHLLVEEPKTLLGDMKKLGAMAKGDLRDANEQSTDAEELYENLRQQLGREMKWNLTPARTVSQSTTYKALVQRFTEGLQVGPASAANYHKLRPGGILDADPFVYKIEPAERDALMHELGVEALVVDLVIVSLNNRSWFSWLGARKYQPKAQNVIRVFVKGRKDPIWFDTWAWGEAEKTIAGDAVNVEDRRLLDQVKVASKKSIGQTLSRYQSH